MEQIGNQSIRLKKQKPKENLFNNSRIPKETETIILVKTRAMVAHFEKEGFTNVAAVLADKLNSNQLTELLNRAGKLKKVVVLAKSNASGLRFGQSVVANISHYYFSKLVSVKTPSWPLTGVQLTSCL